ncbi:MAG: hypothetical protein WC615_07690 [Mucilaginibacter sp.]|uniref:hypothetical protein n=1 Tax=Mucilaginibacter sp. TaxID=1882438 RepID=UPI0035633692
MLLSIFTFSGDSVVQQGTTIPQSEWLVPASRIIKSTVSYARIVSSNHNKQYLFLPQRLQFAIAIAIFNHALAARQAQQAISAKPKQRVFLQIHNHIPKATDPPHQA